MPAARKQTATAVAVPAEVFVIVDTPDQSRVVQAGQPATTMAAFRLPVPAGTAVEDAVRAWLDSAQLPLGTTLYVLDAAPALSFLLRSSLEQM